MVPFPSNLHNCNYAPAVGVYSLLSRPSFKVCRNSLSWSANPPLARHSMHPALCCSDLPGQCPLGWPFRYRLWSKHTETLITPRGPRLRAPSPGCAASFVGRTRCLPVTCLRSHSACVSLPGSLAHRLRRQSISGCFSTCPDVCAHALSLPHLLYCAPLSAGLSPHFTGTALGENPRFSSFSPRPGTNWSPVSVGGKDE